MATATPSSSVPGHISSSNSGYSSQAGNNSTVSETGGYDVNFVDRANPDYACPICHLTFRDPVQTRDCGHRFCETCLEPILRFFFHFHQILLYLLKFSF